VRPGLGWIGRAESGRDRVSGGCTDVAGASEVRIQAAESHRRLGVPCSVMGVWCGCGASSGIWDRLTDHGPLDAADHHHDPDDAVRALAQRRSG
jgi:hypothetical protein